MQLKLLHVSVSQMILYVSLAWLVIVDDTLITYLPWHEWWTVFFPLCSCLWIVCNAVTLDPIVCFINTYCFLQKLKLKLKLKLDMSELNKN